MTSSIIIQGLLCVTIKCLAAQMCQSISSATAKFCVCVKGVFRMYQRVFSMYSTSYTYWEHIRQKP